MIGMVRVVTGDMEVETDFAAEKRRVKLLGGVEAVFLQAKSEILVIAQDEWAMRVMGVIGVNNVEVAGFAEIICVVEHEDSLLSKVQ